MKMQMHGRNATFKLAMASATAIALTLLPRLGLAEETAPPPDYLPIPGGYLHPSCVHQIPSGAAVDTAHGDVRDASGALLAHYDHCEHEARMSNRVRTLAPSEDTPREREIVPADNGWVEWAGQNLPAGATTWNYYYSQITVPPAPVVQNGQTLFYFGSFQSSQGNGDILQPVLQWGHSAAGGGNYWAVASWQVYNFYGGVVEAYVTALMKVAPGNTIAGSIDLTNETYGCGYYNVPACPGAKGSFEEYACGWTRTWQIDASDWNSNQSENETIYLTPAGVCTTMGLNPTPIGSLDYPMTDMTSAVLEAYSKTTCSDPQNVQFSQIYIDANVNNSSETAYVSVNYSPGSNSGVTSNNSPSCFWGSSTSGTTTVLW